MKVNWSAPHPYPLQTPSITEKIYLELGFEPEDEVPNELTSRLFNAGLHWTEGNGPGDPQDQPVADSITDTELPSLTQKQLNRINKLLENAESEIDKVDPGADALDDLKSEFDKLRGSNSGNGSTFYSDRALSVLKELSDNELDDERAAEIRSSAFDLKAFDRSLCQFGRNHLITPREFRVNSHETPTFRFQSGPVEWELSDCRAQNLDFDWAITVTPERDRAFGVRAGSDQLVRLVFDGSTLSGQQAADLITIIPCFLWTIDTLEGYQVASSWTVPLAEDLPSSKYEQLADQISTTLQALKTDIQPEKGTIIDYPDQQFARIRSMERCTICAPIASLPDGADSGTAVTFDVEQRYNILYATEISIADEDSPPWSNLSEMKKEIEARIIEKLESGECPECLSPEKIDRNELRVDVEEKEGGEKPNPLKITVFHTVDNQQYFGSLFTRFTVDRETGLNSVSVFAEIDISWEIRAELQKLVSTYLPIIATTLDENNINPGSYLDPLTIEVGRI